MCASAGRDVTPMDESCITEKALQIATNEDVHIQSGEGSAVLGVKKC